MDPPNYPLHSIQNHFNGRVLGFQDLGFRVYGRIGVGFGFCVRSPTHSRLVPAEDFWRTLSGPEETS